MITAAAWVGMSVQRAQHWQRWHGSRKQ